MNKLVKWIIIVIVGLVVYQRSKFGHTKVVHFPAPQVLSENGETNFYQLGAFRHSPKLTFGEKYSRKKINNYLVNVDNQHKIEIALIDLGYIKIINANYYAGAETFSFEEQVSYKLPEDFNDYSNSVSKVGENFRFVFDDEKVDVEDGSKAVKTEFDVFLKRKGGEIAIKLTHLQPQNSCVTYLREGVVSYKCYGGTAFGEVSITIDQKGKRFQKTLTLSSENALAAFDGFRASGWQWQWVWGMGLGLDSNGRKFSLNLGSIRGLNEDFAYFGDKIVQLQDFQYVLNENSTVGESISFKCSSPVVQLNFKIGAKERKYQDMVVLKSDMIKFEGYWSGHYIHPDTQEVVTVHSVPGLVETADSIF